MLATKLATIVWLPTILMVMLAGRIGLVCSSAGGCSSAYVELKAERKFIESSQHVIYISGDRDKTQRISFDILRACDDKESILLDINRYDESRATPWVPLCTVSVTRVASGCHCSTMPEGISCVIEQTFDHKMFYRYKLKERKARLQETEFIVKLIEIKRTSEAISTKATTLQDNREVPTAYENAEEIEDETQTRGGPATTTYTARILESKQDSQPSSSPTSVPLWIFAVVVAAVIVIVIVIVFGFIVMRRRSQNSPTGRQAGEDIYYDADPSMSSAQPDYETGPGSIYEPIRNQPLPQYSAVNHGRDSRTNNDSRQGFVQQQSVNTVPTHFHSTSDRTPSALLSCETDLPADDVPPLPERKFCLDEMSNPTKKEQESKQQLCTSPGNFPAMRLVQTSADGFLITSEPAEVSIPLNWELLPPPLACKVRPTAESGESILVEANPLNKPASSQHIYESLCQVTSKSSDSAPKRAPDTSSDEATNYLHVVPEEGKMTNSSESKGTLKKAGSSNSQGLPLSVQTSAIRVSFARQRSTTSSGSEAGELSPESPSKVILIRFEGHPMSPISISAQPMLENPCYALTPAQSAVERN